MVFLCIFHTDRYTHVVNYLFANIVLYPYYSSKSYKTLSGVHVLQLTAIFTCLTRITKL